MTEIVASEDYWSLVMTLCQALERTDCRFEIGGFGRADWNFNVSYDASSFIEEIPFVVETLRHTGSASLDLYPQGVERTLDFSIVGDVVEIICTSRTNWIPNPGRERVDSAIFDAMVSNFAIDFASSIEMLNPNLVEVGPFSEWKNGVLDSPYESPYQL